MTLMDFAIVLFFNSSEFKEVWELCIANAFGTPHTAIEAIGGLNLPGGGASPPFENIRKWYLNILSTIIDCF